MAKPLKKTSSSLACLPDEIVLECLVRVTRRDYENLSCVSKRLRSLVRSPELHRMRSRLHKDSVYICIWERDNYSTDPTYLCFTLRRTTTTEFQLVPISFPCRYFMFRSSTNLRRGRRKEKLEMPIVYRLRQGKMMATNDWVWCICVADYKLFAFFTDCGLMWLDTKHNTWRVVSGGMPRKLYGGPMAEYYGKLAVFWRGRTANKKEEKIWCAVIALGRVGEEEVGGTIEWSGVVATIPYVCGFLHCLVASD